MQAHAFDKSEQFDKERQRTDRQHERLGGNSMRPSCIILLLQRSPRKKLSMWKSKGWSKWRSDIEQIETIS
jgi:hypothetical protein